MLGKLAGWEDTIVALATPPGVGAIGVIRVSGKSSWSIVNQLFTGKDLCEQASHTLHVGVLKDGEEQLDEVVVSLFRGPRSYTGEDVVEISCHGSPYVQQRVLQALVARGARLAKAGEFTQRAFLNGKLDLTQAEAVADLIASNTAASARTALHTMRGGFSRALRELREQLISFSALIELELDFSQEDVEFADRTQLYHLIDEAEEVTSSLLASFKLGNVIRNGVAVAIVGRPNAGKSTLLNTLLNEDRAIVSEIAGTTRDTIEEVLNIDGVLFRLIDTAGIREHVADVIEEIGVGRSREKMELADIIVYLFDVGDSPSAVAAVRGELVERGKPFLLVGNKVDVLGEEEARLAFPQELLISARDARHIDVLRQRLVDIVLEGRAATGDGTVVTNARHYHALQQVAVALGAVRRGLDELLPGDLVALDIRVCLHWLGEITGEVTTEDRLDYIFSKFCIGK
ncbi:MAG: tRNA uridine-5-carboxymethylaminomethyl(34) synthesis GTPase MnmE [Bacteroidetes bacterium]|nr:tRNA uridine-5-carboxymethylaminomethyl(34) synthesis GTPase MnmE [Bacteroidota bacterium]